MSPIWGSQSWLPLGQMLPHVAAVLQYLPSRLLLPLLCYVASVTGMSRTWVCTSRCLYVEGSGGLVPWVVTFIEHPLNYERNLEGVTQMTRVVFSWQGKRFPACYPCCHCRAQLRRQLYIIKPRALPTLRSRFPEALSI